MLSTLILLAALIALITLLALGFGFWAWVCCAGLVLLAGWQAGVLAVLQVAVLAALFGTLALVFGQAGVRRNTITRPLMVVMRKLLPRVSETEAAALEAGTIWWEAELFSGRPNWKRLMDIQARHLSERERAFLDGPVHELCRMVDDWQVTQDGDLPPAVWEFMKAKGFLGLIIPEEFGGLGFSARAHSAVVARLSTRSVTASVSVMVPNSLGPAELLLHYGTEVQKRYYLPRLARGEDIPCFALTGPENGSDAAAMQARGVICHGPWRGEQVLGIKLDWDKRYTTLGPVATLIGMAFRLHDPEHLLGDTEDLGITCALVPADLPGVEIGQRHDPMGIPFLNGPNKGRGVFVPLDAIIGGKARAGQGWRMLMDCLSAGRSISLPSLSAGCCQLTTRITGAYATVRRQFNLAIGRFEGVQERLARIAGLTYMVDAARLFTVGAVDAGEKPSVCSAIVKAWTTEAMRTVVNDGMDVLAGAGVSRGPRNPLARAYQAVPIGITVEGANILTRSLIVFGQGAIRCHPFVTRELAASASRDLIGFDAAFFGHVNHACGAAARAFVAGLYDGGLPRIAGMEKPLQLRVRRRLGRLARLSADYALLSELSMATLGGNLKRKELLSGRLADGLAWMYMASASLKRYVDQGQTEADAAFMGWAVDHALHQTEQALRGTLENLPNRPAAWVGKLLMLPITLRNRPPSDKLVTEAAAKLIEGRDGRRRLTPDVFIPDRDEVGLGKLEAALDLVVAALPVETLVRQASKDGKISAEPVATLYQRAVDQGLITPEQRRQVREAAGAARDVVQVDAFEPDEYRALRG